MASLLALAPDRSFGEKRNLEWRTLQAGLELAVVDLGPRSPFSDNRLVVVRVDPRRAQLKLALASTSDKRPRSAGEWCVKAGFAVAINAGMFKDDGMSNVGYLVDGGQINNAKWVGKYHSALGLVPKDPGLPPAVMVDLDEAGGREKIKHYQTVVQNLRLIKSVGGKGKSVWQDQPRRWSESAVALDDHSRVLLLFSRTPYSMAEFNRLVLGLPLGIERAMHVEGGPEASLSIHVGGTQIDHFGSYETGFLESDGNQGPWPIPNVLGVVGSQ